MKKLLIVALSLVAVLFVFSSCHKEDTGLSGKVTYSVDSNTGSLPSSDIEAWSAIDKLYRNEIGSISGITYNAKKYTMEGNYDKCDAAVLSACKAAEAKAAQYTLTGGFKLTVDAMYDNGGTTKEIYSHKFGN